MRLRGEGSPNPGAPAPASSSVRLRYRKGVLLASSAPEQDTAAVHDLRHVTVGRTNSAERKSSILEQQASGGCADVDAGANTTPSRSSSSNSDTSSDLREDSVSSEEASMRDMAFKSQQSSAHCHHHHSSKTTNQHSQEQLPQYLPHIQPRPVVPCHNGNGSVRRRDGSKEFVPAFVLLEAAQSLNERKIRELVRKLSCLASAEVEPVVNFQDPTGRTALSYACGAGSVVIIEELSKLRRLDPNMPDNDGNSPLHYASQAGHSEAVDLMLSRFEGIVDPNCRNGTGLTPLMKAALQGRTRCAKSLICAGASPQLRDYSRGLSAIEWARLCGRHICAEVIIRSSKDHYRHPGSPPASAFSSGHHRSLPASQSSFELKRINSDDSPYHNLQNARNVVSGATWLKNKIKKVLGTAGTGPASNPPSAPDVRPETYALMSNLGGATLCAGSLLLPSIKPLLEQQKPKVSRKLTIPTLQVTMDKK